MERFKFDSKKPKELSDIVDDIKKFNGEEILAKNDYPSSYEFKRVYFIKTCAIFIAHNLHDTNGPFYYLYVNIYGNPPEEVTKWLKNNETTFKRARVL